MEQMTAAQVTTTTTPTVTYDWENFQINATVIVTPSPEPGGAPTFIDPLIAIPSSTPGRDWIVTWTLSAEGEFEFDAMDGIKIDHEVSLPDEVLILHEPALVDGHFQATFRNHVEEVNSLRYFINIFERSVGARKLVAQFRHDPTIAVVKDPVG
jgi:hypothetical protein